MQTIYGVTSGENIVQAFTEENTTEANFHQSINNAAILTFTTTEPLKAGVQFFLTKDPINDYKHEEFMYFEITDQDFDGYEYTYRAEEYAYHDLDTMGYVKKVYTQGKWTTRTLLESIVYNDVEPKGVARTKWEIIDNDLTLPTTWAGEGNTYTLWYNTPLRGIEKFIEYFGGEIRFYVTIFNNKISRHYLEIYEKRGRETGKRYESNSNLISLTNKAEYDNRYEYIIPLGEGGGTSGDEQKHNTPNGFNNYITLEGLEVGKSTDKWYKPKSQMYISLANDKNAYPLKSQPKGLQNNPRIKPVTFEEVKSKQALFNKAIEWLENNQGVAWSYSASVLDIGESQVGDTIAIIDERSGISSYVRVHDIDYDMIDPENTGVHFGSNWGYENDEAITDMLNTATAARHDTIALIDTAIRQSNGKNTNYYGKNEPADPTAGDLWYKQAGDETYLMIFKDGQWVELVSTRTQKVISDAVDEATSEANSYADSLNATQASEAAAFQSEANAALSSAASERKVFSSNAASMATSAATHADSMANSAAAYGKAQADSVLSSANSALATAKQELGSEVSKAQADITATNKELAGKVSQTDFDKTTGDLSTKYGQVKATADAVTTDVAKYKDTNDKKVSANTANIATMSDQITSKVSKTDFDKKTGELNGKFTQQKQTVDSISNTVTELQAKVNAQGQINQLMNTEFNPDLEGWTFTNNSGTSKPYKSYVDKAIGSTSIGFNTVGDPENTYGATIVQEIPVSAGSNGIAISMRWDVRTVRNDYYTNLWLTFKDATGVQTGRINRQWSYTTADNRWHEAKWENVAVPDGTRTINVTFAVRENTTQYLARPMLVFGSTIGDYVAGNYNNNERVAELEVGIDHITGLVNDPKKGLSATATLASNGMTFATKAQSDATTAIQTANGIQTQVTSNDGDIKNLQSKQTQTASQITKEVSDRKSGDSTLNTQLRDYIGTQVNSVTSGYKSAIEQSANGIYASISLPNQLRNTEFTPDLDGWTITNTGGTSMPYRSYIDKSIGSVSIGFNTVGDSANTYGSTVTQDVPVSAGSNGIPVSMRWDVRTVRNDYYTNLWLTFKDSTGAQLGRINKQWSYTTADNRWHEIKWENVALPDGTRTINVTFAVRENTTQYLARPMLVFGSTIGTYMPGTYSGMNTSTVLELFKDNWALGIADNAGRLISGINGDRSGTVIQGKKLVINSDTTITGKAFINGAVIKDGSISNAQIGNAAVGSAQIINVDVSKISGNIANFITANINTLNAKVLYGDTGHLGTTDTGRVINKQDNHLQLASKGMYNSANDRAQLELLSHTNDIDANMQGSFNYYSDVRKGHGLGIRLVQNQILAIDEDGGSKMLYLSPYQGGEVRVVSRDKQAYYPMRASSFNTMSSRSAKSNIVPFEDCALDIVKNTKIRTYVKSGKQEIGVISDEADPRMLTDDDNAVSLYDYTSILYKAVQELTEKVEELQKERPNDY